MWGRCPWGAAPLLRVWEAMKISADIQIDRAELERRVAEYQRTDEFQLDILDLIYDYKMQGLPVPEKEQLHAEAVSLNRECLKAIMTCEASGHLWKEKDADPENGTSTLTCRRCGAEEHLRW